jgi:hypothetical protein
MTRTGLLLGKVPRGGLEGLGGGELCMVGKSGAGVLRTSPPAEGSAKGGANTLWGFVNGGTPHRRNDRFLTLASPEDRDFAPAQGRKSPSAEGLMAVESSPSPTGLVFGPFSALRSFDDAAPGELAGEGWDSDAD